MEGLQLINMEDIVSCSAESNYTRVCLKNNHKILISRTLKEIEEMLEGTIFYRVHHSFLVNINEISKYIKGEGGYLIMNDGSNIDVSRSKKEGLLKRLIPGRT
jgi:two-component system LytT family response regulator